MKKLVYKLFGHNKLQEVQASVQAMQDQVKYQTEVQQKVLTETTDKLQNIEKQLAEQERVILRSERVIRSNRDNIPYLREKLLKARRSKEYQAVLKNKSPLISIRIATYNRAELLTTRTIPSILAQTYENWELIIVGDHCTDDTEEKIRKLNDPRIRFYNFPFRNLYPDDPQDRWFSAGSPGMNKGVELAKGDWIAPQDDDDEFEPDHLEVLLKTALEGQYEMVYGKLKQYNTKTKVEKDIWSYPPQIGQYSSQAAIYMRLLDFFEYDTKSWIVSEPGDWNHCRRMLEAGVNIGTIEKVVGKMYFTPKV
ncbi:MAG TPA: glycosyltransferase family 2 protein [Candidatus Dormibacteraeota bacterium]|nr:glycosyltransferase family 2 protein [Candidatus Dormibacteraeota bacterium]